MSQTDVRVADNNREAEIAALEAEYQDILARVDVKVLKLARMRKTVPTSIRKNFEMFKELTVERLNNAPLATVCDNVNVEQCKEDIDRAVNEKIDLELMAKTMEAEIAEAQAQSAITDSYRDHLLRGLSDDRTMPLLPKKNVPMMNN